MQALLGLAVNADSGGAGDSQLGKVDATTAAKHRPLLGQRDRGLRIFRQRKPLPHGRGAPGDGLKSAGK